MNKNWNKILISNVYSVYRFADIALEIDVAVLQ